jgi:hypothetical protein
MRASRRSFLAAGSAVVGALSAAGTVRAQDAPASTILGYSQGELPLTVFHLGWGPKRVFVMGGQHGGPEVNTVRLTNRLMQFYVSYPWEIPAGISLDLMPMANPDGVSIGSRQFLSGVDPNRNWDGGDWSSDAWDSNGVFRPGLGGPTSFSEQETRAVADYLVGVKPALVVNYHSAGNFMFGNGELGDAYANASGYWRPGGPPGGGTDGEAPRGGASPLTYRATGSMNPWLRAIGINSVFVELSTPSSEEFDRNLAGLQAALALIGSS